MVPDRAGTAHFGVCAAGLNRLFLRAWRVDSRAYLSFDRYLIKCSIAFFIISSVLSLVCLRKWLKGLFKGFIVSKQKTSENIEEFIGKRAVVKEKITPQAPGKIEFHGTNWAAEADEEIAAGTPVKIIGKDNITLKVKPWPPAGEPL